MLARAWRFKSSPGHQIIKVGLLLGRDKKNTMHKLAFDHAVIYVPNLHKAIRQFTALGFTVRPGGEHSHTHNALIIFNDRSYIELLALKPSWRRWFLLGIAKSGVLDLIANSKSDIGWRVMRWISCKYGPIDWALRTDNLNSTMACLKEKDAVLLNTSDYQRTTAEGKTAKWTMASAKNLDLPFLIKDQTDINLRVPLGNHTQHANGALGIRKITISAENTELAYSNLNALLSLSNKDLKGVNAEVKLQETIIEYKKLSHLAGKFILELRYQGREPKLLNCDYPKGTNIWLTPSDS